jgi:hypothetical protein
MPPQIKFSVSIPGCDRIHHINAEDVRVVLSRLPVELWQRLRSVHFNDQSWGARTLGYVNASRRDIALCALPPRMSLARIKGMPKPEEFGARRNQKWPALAIRRYMLYDVFLHELGHLQLIDEKARTPRLKFAHEKLAREFAVKWRRQLWSQPFPHSNPVHNPPTPEELALLPPSATSRELLDAR